MLDLHLLLDLLDVDLDNSLLCNLDFNLLNEDNCSSYDILTNDEVSLVEVNLVVSLVNVDSNELLDYDWLDVNLDNTDWSNVELAGDLVYDSLDVDSLDLLSDYDSLALDRDDDSLWNVLDDLV